MIHTPAHVQEKLKSAVLKAVDNYNSIPEEGDVGAIYGESIHELI